MQLIAFPNRQVFADDEPLVLETIAGWALMSALR